MPKMWRRDSSDFLVDLYAGPIFRTSTVDALVEHEEYPGMIAIDYNLLAALQPSQSPSGNHDCQEVKGEITSLGGPCHRIIGCAVPIGAKASAWCSPAVVLLHERFGYETRLVSYNVQ
jgi:hypothetical protein